MENGSCWQTVSLGEYLDIKTGYPFKSRDYIDESSGIKLLRGDNIVQGKLRWDGVKRWPSDRLSQYSDYFLQSEDVVVAMDRPWIEAGLKYAWITESDLPCLLVQRVARLRGINGLLTAFARYVVGHHSFTDYIKGIWTGVAVPHISESQIRAFRFQLPPVAIQQGVIRTLAAYDDLIENNTRQSKLCAEMAQTIYREWFVNFRFPGYEKVGRVNSEMGPIPKGWRVARVQDFGEIITGKTPSKEQPKFFGGDIPFIKLPDMHGKMFVLDTAEHLSVLGQQNQANKTIPSDTLCVSCIGTAGIVIITTRPSQTNQQINSVVLRSVRDREFLYFRLLDLRETINQYGANGVTMVNLNKTKFENLRIVTPEESLIERFHSHVAPMFEQIRNCQECVSNLSQTRDLLLPKLISGEIGVEPLEVEAVSQGV